MSEDYLVPFAEGEAEFTEKRSRFIGRVFYVESEAQARERIEQVKKQHYDARHNCWCYALHDSGAVRYSDDGEPQGTAGQPMLGVFQREGVENVVCVVTRYFGGVLLGAGGLTRAYAKSAKDALDAAGVARMSLWARYRVACPYALFERFTRLLAPLGGVVEGTDYGAEIAVTLRVPKACAGELAAALTELSLGALGAELLGEAFLPGARER